MVFSSNHLDACTALVGVSKLITEDMIPAVIGDVMIAILDLYFAILKVFFAGC